MLRSISYRRIAFVAALLLGLVATGSVRADGMIGYKNDTTYTIVVQSSIVVNNVERKGKPQMLYPGEVALDGQVGTGTRRITIYDPKSYDPKKANTPLHQEDVILKKDMFFSILAETQNVQVKGPQTPPKFKLEPKILPTMPTKPTNPGVTQPKKP
ncbi:MAG TPA: hypothetical protein VKS79_03825 [Gemmataceae bacterium]|nr:hypothetical protein [Gemmataceae bacterium]